jgi:hypothetical protein
MDQTSPRLPSLSGALSVHVSYSSTVVVFTASLLFLIVLLQDYSQKQALTKKNGIKIPGGPIGLPFVGESSYIELMSVQLDDTVIRMQDRFHF